MLVWQYQSWKGSFLHYTKVSYVMLRCCMLPSRESFPRQRPAPCILWQTFLLPVQYCTFFPTKVWLCNLSFWLSLSIIISTNNKYRIWHMKPHLLHLHVFIPFPSPSPPPLLSTLSPLPSPPPHTLPASLPATLSPPSSSLQLLHPLLILILLRPLSPPSHILHHLSFPSPQCWQSLHLSIALQDPHVSNTPWRLRRPCLRHPPAKRSTTSLWQRMLIGYTRC